MEERFHSLAGKIFKKDLSEITTEEAASLATQYPYFAPLQFIKLTQSEPGTEAYQLQYQKSILYYPDPLTFDHFLQNGQEFQFEVEDTTVVAPDENETEEVQVPPAVVYPEEEPAGVKEEPIELTVVEAPEEPLAIDDEVPDQLGPEPVETPADSEEVEVEQGAADDTNAALPKVTMLQPELTGAELTFEPYHTVDYFASQGIKVTAETVSQDKFGKQVKSFTDWLKTMKRLPLAELGKNVTPTTEKKVENLAEHSVQDADVVTESMAQVWEKQGNIAKATEVYRKLSLQNPSKRAYFAAKIDKLTEEI
ncbi:MAG TPA: hypothetical protein VM843_03270 [Flavisolibacter sp.]|nr:hypothetical protein [Flavisolibacter sp.]